ncbi:MAG: DinB family protein [Candidatus Nanopelagicales bacterium]
MSDREVRTLAPMADAPEVGRWLAAMIDGRNDTVRELEGVSDEVVDVRPLGSENSIGTTLYHVALIEADWLCDDIFGEQLDESELARLFPFVDRDGEGQLTNVQGESLAEHLQRLSAVREVLIERMRPMSVDDFHTPRRRERYDVSPAWVLHHLLQHESEHRAEIGWLKRHTALT